MIPPLIIQTALDRQINLLAITDHNSTYNIAAIIKAAENTNIHILPGMELQTREEIHSLCLFDSMVQALKFQEIVTSTMPGLSNKAEYFGEQFVVDASGNFLRREESMLLASSSLSLKEAWVKVNGLGGLLIPSHVERSVFGLLPVLGFIPQDIQLEALEISKNTSADKARQQYPQLKNYPLIQNGDAHQLEDILGMITFHIELPTINEIRLAFQHQDGRSFFVKP